MQLHIPDQSAAVFAALGDPTRLRLLSRLGREERSLSTLAEGAGMSRQAVTKHLDVLARVGLVHSQRQGRERLYTATPGPLEGASDWIRSYRQQWEDAFDRLDEYLQSLPEDPKP